MTILDGELTTRALVRMGCTVPIFLVAADPDSVDAVGLGAMGAVSLPLEVADLVELFLFSYRSNIGLEHEAEIERQDTQVVSRDVILLNYCMCHDKILLSYRLCESDYSVSVRVCMYVIIFYSTFVSNHR